MKKSTSTLKEAKTIAEQMSQKLKTPFSVIFDYAFDGMNDWRVTVGKYRTAAYVAETR